MERSNINQLLKRAIRHKLQNKLQNYRPEPASMPFHTRLLGKDSDGIVFVHSFVEY
jgi:type II restriction enzyme